MLRPVRVDQTVADGETLPLADGIRVLAAPGHTPDNMAYFWERKRVLFAPDLLNTRGDDVLKLTPKPITWDMAAARSSATKVLDLDPASICVGHGETVDTAKRPDQVQNLRAALA